MQARSPNLLLHWRLRSHIKAVYSIHTALVVLAFVSPQYPWVLAWWAMSVWLLRPYQQWMDRLWSERRQVTYLEAAQKTHKDLVNYCSHRIAAEIAMILAFYSKPYIGLSGPVTAYLLLIGINLYGLFLPLMPLIRMDWTD